MSKQMAFNCELFWHGEKRKLLLHACWIKTHRLNRSSVHCKVHTLWEMSGREKKERFRKRMFWDWKRPTELLILTL